MDRGSLAKLFAWFANRTGLSRFICRFSDAFQLKKNYQGKGAFPFIKKRRSRNCQILAYHRVNNDEDVFFPGIPIKRFEQQMRFLREHFTICPLKELVQRMKDDDLPENAIAVTFDDGYRDNYLNAFPLLKCFSVSATIFLATGAIGSKRPLWHDKVFAAFRGTIVPELAGFVPSNPHLSLTSVKQKLEAQKQILEYLWAMDGEEREIAIRRLGERLEVLEMKDAETCRLMLSWEEVSAMNRDGIQFGAHTVTHPILSKLTVEDARREISGSKRTIDERLENAVTTFAYPVGRRIDFTETTKALVEEAGFCCGLTMVCGNNEVETDPYEMRRIAPWDEDYEAFGLRLSYYKISS
jgi:peptidoglycan/xylan/chitin deacetylase (PgdA/CDA1 family)